MAEKVKEQDFVEINYTGKLVDGTVFDTTEEKVARDSNIFEEKMKFGPATICVGEHQVLPGLEQSLIGKEIGQEYTITLKPEQAFGKRDVKNMRIMPMSAFKEHNMQPQPGLQIDVDGKMGTITRVSGGRIIVNFNHPLAGKEVVYDVKLIRIVIEADEKIKSYLNSTLKVPEDKIKVEIKDEIASIDLPTQLPEQFTEMIGKRLAELVKLKEVNFVKKGNK